MLKYIVLFAGMMIATLLKYSDYNHILVFDLDLVLASLTGMTYGIMYDYDKRYK